MDRLLPFDELNTLKTIVTNIFSEDEHRQEYKQYIIDEILEILVLSYIFGNEAANQMLETEYEIDQVKVDAAVYENIAGENWVQRVSDYIDNGTAADIIRVAETDAHRIYNEAIMDVGREAYSEGGRKILKTWETMLDDRVRDTHEYLEGETIPFEDDFYTFDGDFAQRPGGFNDPSNNINCRCRIVLSDG